MKIACVRAIADLAMAEVPDVVANAYAGRDLSFGREYLIPTPFDPRLIVEIPSTVAQAAIDSGVATRPFSDMESYRTSLSNRVFRTGYVMEEVFINAKKDPKRLVYAEGEDARVSQAVQIVCDEGLAKPILIGRPEVISARIEKFGLRIAAGEDFEIVNPLDDSRYRDYWQTYHEIMERSGVSPATAKTMLRTENTVIAAVMVHRGDADAMLAGPVGSFRHNLRHVLDIIGLAEGVHDASALQLLVLAKGTYFIADTNVTYDPDAKQIAEMALLSAKQIRRFGIEPKVALVSHSNFGSRNTPTATKMREALQLLHAQAPDLEVEGEMHADAALSQRIRGHIFPNSRLEGEANLLIAPNLDAANIGFNMVKQLASGLSIGPMLLGMRKTAHVLGTSVSVRGTVNMSAVAVIDAQIAAKG